MKTVYEQLAETGLAACTPLYSTEHIVRWNKLLELHFSNADNQDADRYYANAFELYEMGILGQIFNERLRALIQHLMPDAVLYHCHVYDVLGDNNAPHIHGENGFDGWHRDEECLPGFKFGHPVYVSLFVYLTDVKPDNGPFEFCNLPPHSRSFMAQRPYTQLLGDAGFSFLFNRAYLHRASPNKSDITRRVLKLSLQPGHFNNGRIKLAQFTKVLARIDEADSFLRQLFGAAKTVNSGVQRDLSKGLSSLPEPIELVENRRVEVSLSREAIARTRKILVDIKTRASKKLRVTSGR